MALTYEQKLLAGYLGCCGVTILGAICFWGVVFLALAKFVFGWEIG